MELSTLFKIIFHDSKIAEQFPLNKTKCAYTINFGLAVFFEAYTSFKNQPFPFFVLCYDESLNKVLQHKQMDCWVRYWDELKGIVKSK